METPARKKKMDPARDPSRELQDLLETVARSVVGDAQGVTVCPAKGKGFVHFEIRCPQNTLSVLENNHASLRLLMQVAGAARRMRITMQFHEQNVHEATTVAPGGGDRSGELENLVSTMARALADSPNDVVVFPADGDGFSHYDVRCDHKDVGALLGSRGAHVGAMRNLLVAAGEARGIRASLHVMARDGNG